MKVRINGESIDIEASISLSELLQRMTIPSKGVAVELNKQVISSKEPWGNIVLKEGDTLEIVHAVGGG